MDRYVQKHGFRSCYFDPWNLQLTTALLPLFNFSLINEPFFYLLSIGQELKNQLFTALVGTV